MVSKTQSIDRRNSTRLVDRILPIAGANTRHRCSCGHESASQGVPSCDLLWVQSPYSREELVQALGRADLGSSCIPLCNNRPAALCQQRFYRDDARSRSRTRRGQEGHTKAIVGTRWQSKHLFGRCITRAILFTIHKYPAAATGQTDWNEGKGKPGLPRTPMVVELSTLLAIVKENCVRGHSSMNARSHRFTARRARIRGLEKKKSLSDWSPI